MLRPQDRLLFNKLHPEDGRLLKEDVAGDRRVAVHRKDGWLLPVPERRALLLIDNASNDAMHPQLVKSLGRTVVDPKYLDGSTPSQDGR
ncbi:23S rRNA (adenine(2030)-N(6))-methyltransferase RlmJ [Pseudomonas sp. No.117]